MIKKSINPTLVCNPTSENTLTAYIEQTKFNICKQSWTIRFSQTGTFEFPESLLKKLNWEINNEISWIDQENGTFTLTKINSNSHGSSEKENARHNRASSKASR